jgi:predicted ATPase
MKITFNKKTRNIEAGVIIDFSIIDSLKSITMVGDNGCGKSTLIQAIRGSFPPQTKSLFESDYKDLVKKGEIVLEHNYENVFFMDGVLDNGTHFMNAFDAPNFVDMGGFAKGRKSHGEGSLIDIHSFMEKNKSKIVKDKTLMVFDEIDNGLSLKNMSLFQNFVNRVINQYGCHVIISTHNPFLISQSIVCFDMEAKTMKSSSKYIEEKTGYKIEKVNFSS